MESRYLSDIDEGESGGRKKFGTFGGVFTPTLLTILGVIVFIREGWVIGNAGFVGGLLIIALAFLITVTTGLSMSSITSNIRIGSGGAYAIVSQSLGLEVGGSLGIPRYISQALAITLYIFGFREGWLWVFPDHHPLVIDLVVFVTIWLIAYKSADLAIKTQYVIMAVIAGALVSIAVAAAQGSMQYDLDGVGVWGSFPGAPETDFQGTTFWTVFAVFFPAVTGIMAGANMSGDLINPRRSIPIGTMSAIGVSIVIYVALAYWLARSASPEELISNYYVMIEKAAWGPAVIAGLFGATFSSALASMVGAGRILQAMGSHRVIPGSGWLGKLTKAGEPRNAMLTTGGIVLATLLVRDLNAIAPLITMFFLITYAMLNVVVIVEQGLGLVSFRPLLRVPIVIPWIGLIGSVYVMFIINPILSLFSVAVVLVFYGVLVSQDLDAPFEDVRSGLFVSFAEWAAKKVAELPSAQHRAWKPNLLVPVDNPVVLRGSFALIQSITYPKGSVKILGMKPGTAVVDFGNRLSKLANDFRKDGVFSSATVVDGESYESSVISGMQVLKGAFFRPNIVFVPAPKSDERREVFPRIIRAAAALQLGVVIHAPHPDVGLGQRQSVNVWIRDRSPDWKLRWDIGNMDLSILIAYKLKLNWNASLRLVTVVQNAEEEENARQFMSRLMDLARLPRTEVIVAVGNFSEYVPRAPQADMNIFGLGEQPDFEFIEQMSVSTKSSCLYVLDSGRESALA
ncbi:MAG: Na-K-Cl cotransporter [Rhodothermales bacterium]|nr:Na-K-Cl cotransporter [Rhodothermales bacterium]